MVATCLLISFASVFVLSQASPTHYELVRHELIDTVPSGFIQNGLASNDLLLPLRMALVSNNLAGLEKVLYSVSTPGSDLYGQYLTKEEAST